MKIYSWQVESFVLLNDGSLRKENIVVKTKSSSKASLFKEAKELIAKRVKTTFKRITICWFELLDVKTEKSKYQQFCLYKQKKLSRNKIRTLLNLPFWKLKEFEDYYSGKTKRLTYSKYKELRKQFSNESIRKHYKIPICEFQKFLKLNQSSKTCLVS